MPLEQTPKDDLASGIHQKLTLYPLRSRPPWVTGRTLKFWVRTMRKASRCATTSVLIGVVDREALNNLLLGSGTLVQAFYVNSAGLVLAYLQPVSRSAARTMIAFVHSVAI